jgi:PhnB protein
MAVRPVPEGFHTVTPYLIVRGATQALDFYRKALGATEIMRIVGPGDTVAHAEIKIGDSIIMLSEEYPQMNFRSPASIGATGITIHLYVPDVDAAFDRAVAAGAKVLRPVADQFYGDRTGMFEDPSGHVWSLATHIEDVPPEEIQRRAAALGQ